MAVSCLPSRPPLLRRTLPSLFFRGVPSVPTACPRRLSVALTPGTFFSALSISQLVSLRPSLNPSRPGSLAYSGSFGNSLLTRGDFPLSHLGASFILNLNVHFPTPVLCCVWPWPSAFVSCGIELIFWKVQSSLIRFFLFSKLDISISCFDYGFDAILCEW